MLFILQSPFRAFFFFVEREIRQRRYSVMLDSVRIVLGFSPTDIGFVRIDIVTFPKFTVYAVYVR